MTCPPGRRAFSRDSLDRAMVAAPPMLVALLTVQAPGWGGDALLADLAPALHHLPAFQTSPKHATSTVLASTDWQRPSWNHWAAEVTGSDAGWTPAIRAVSGDRFGG